MPRKITIIKVRNNSRADINDELQWLGNSLGLFNMRDKNSSCFRVFITLIKTAKQNEPLSSDAIAERLHLARGTVVHHLHKLQDAGIVVREKKGYILRENTLQQVIRDVRRDMESMFEELSSVAKDIDEKLGQY